MLADRDGPGVVVCPQPAAAETGAQILRGGGNAVDAAVAAAFVQMVVDPFNASPGGMGQALVWLSPEERAARRDSADLEIARHLKCMEDGPLELSFHARAGSAAHEEMWAHLIRGRTDFWGQVILEGEVNDVGYESIMIPGTTAGLWSLQRSFGRLDWDECLQPAIETARLGFPVRSSLYRYWTYPSELGVASGADRLRSCAETARQYLPDGGHFPFVGDLLSNETLARTLERLAREGGPSFYTGDLGSEACHDLEAHGSTIRFDDFRNYRVRIGPALHRRYRGRDVFTIAAPGGGPSILQILLALEQLDARSIDPWSHEAAELFIYVARAVFASRDKYVGDPEFVDMPADYLLSEASARKLADSYKARRPIGVPDDYVAGVSDTTHVSVIDRNGSTVSLTQTIGTGSGVTTPGLGFLWNNSFYLADPRPGRPNSIQPGKARLTGMAPTMVFREARPEIVIGAPGGSSIISGIAQVVRNLVEHRMSTTEAVDFPRVHAEGRNVRLEARFSSALVDRLHEQGLRVVHGPDGFEPGVSLVQAIAIRESRRESGWTRGVLDPGSDPRGDGGIAWS